MLPNCECVTITISNCANSGHIVNIQRNKVISLVRQNSLRLLLYVLSYSLLGRMYKL